MNNQDQFEQAILESNSQSSNKYRIKLVQDIVCEESEINTEDSDSFQDMLNKSHANRNGYLRFGKLYSGSLSMSSNIDNKKKENQDLIENLLSVAKVAIFCGLCVVFNKKPEFVNFSMSYLSTIIVF